MVDRILALFGIRGIRTLWTGQDAKTLLVIAFVVIAGTLTRCVSCVEVINV